MAYRVVSQEEAERLDDAAKASRANVRLDIHRASNYVLTVVLYAVTSFAGMRNQVTRRPLRITMVAMAGAVVLGALVWTATFPVSIKI